MQVVIRMTCTVEILHCFDFFSFWTLATSFGNMCFFQNISSFKRTFFQKSASKFISSGSIPFLVYTHTKTCVYTSKCHLALHLVVVLMVSFQMVMPIFTLLSESAPLQSILGWSYLCEKRHFTSTKNLPQFLWVQLTMPSGLAPRKGSVSDTIRPVCVSLQFLCRYLWARQNNRRAFFSFSFAEFYWCWQVFFIQWAACQKYLCSFVFVSGTHHFLYIWGCYKANSHAMPVLVLILPTSFFFS